MARNEAISLQDIQHHNAWFGDSRAAIAARYDTRENCVEDGNGYRPRA